MIDLQKRMAELEIRQAFQDESLQTLSDIVVGQQKVIELLQRKLELLQQRQAEQANQYQDIPDELPPHY